MNQGLTTEEILNRLRLHVSQHTPAQPPPANESLPRRNEPPLLHPGLADEGTIAASRTEPQNFSRLRVEIDTALEGTRLVGQLNPRNPGLVSGAIQFFKKLMRRALSWYTRPIHYFQGAVIRALQETLVLLQGHEASLMSSSKDLVLLAGSVQGLREELANQKASLTDELAALMKAVSVAKDHSALESQIEQTRVYVSEVESQIEQTRAEVQSQVEQAQAYVDDRLRRIPAELENISGRVQSSTEQRLAQMNAALVEHIHRGLSASDQQIAGVQVEIGRLQHAIASLANEQREARIHSRVRERDWRRFFHDIQAVRKEPAGAQSPEATPPMFPSGIKSETEFDYYLFEELHRGDETLIATRQREYLDYFKGCENVVDIGCGRGEFLEILRENGISARGVELGTDQYLLCQEKGLDVVQQDLFQFLESVPDASLGGLFSAQVIEHLTASDQLRFVALAYAKTSPGAPVIIETINAQSVFAVMRNFFMDPTHVRPIHPETLKFAMKSVNFREVELRYSSQLREKRIPALEVGDDPARLADFNRATEELNDFIYGYLDYAAIGRH